MVRILVTVRLVASDPSESSEGRSSLVVRKTAAVPSEPTSSDERPESLARWLLERAQDEGLALTKTGALARVVVREVAELWPEWWDHELFGPPHRELELRALEETREGLQRLRLLRRYKGRLRTTARARDLAAEPHALLRVLREEVHLGEPFDAAAWDAAQAALMPRIEPLDNDELVRRIGNELRAQGWRSAGEILAGDALFGALIPLLTRAEGFGLLESDRGERRSHLRWGLSAAAHALAVAATQTRRIPPEPGDQVLVVAADLLNAPGVRARLAVLERQHLTALHDVIQEAFGWLDDHLYSFWLDGGFFSDAPGAEYTTPVTPDEGPPTADLPIAELGLRINQQVGYVFDFGDERRVRLTVVERGEAEVGGAYPRVLELRGTPPPQYPAFEDDELG